MNPWALLCRFAGRVRYWRDGNVGRHGEEQAHRYLRSRGCTVVARNWRPPQGGGEIDLIAWEDKTLVFVEVKTRVSGDINAPERDIDREKMNSLRRAARDYVRRAAAEEFETRFDIVAISEGKIEYMRDAFELLPARPI